MQSKNSANALNALTTVAGLLSMAGAATLGETIGFRTIYIVCGLIVAGAGLFGFSVLKEPEAPSSASIVEEAHKTQQVLTGRIT